MATNTIEVKIKADTKGIEEGSKKAAQSLEKVGDAAKDTGQEVSALSGVFETFKATVTVAITGGLVAFTAKMIDTIKIGRDLRFQLQNVGGSLRDLTATANRAGLGIGDVASNYLRLSQIEAAGGRSAGIISLKSSLDDIIAIGNKSGGLGNVNRQLESLASIRPFGRYTVDDVQALSAQMPGLETAFFRLNRYLADNQYAFRGATLSGQELADMLQGEIGTIAESAKAGGIGLSGYMNVAVNNVSLWVNELMDAFENGGVFEAFSDFFSGITAWIRTIDFSPFTRGISSAFEWAKSFITETDWQAWATTVKAAWTVVRNSVVSAWNWLDKKLGITEKFNQLKEFVSKGVEDTLGKDFSIGKFFEDMWTSAVNSVMGFDFAGLFKNISGAIEEGYETLRLEVLKLFGADLDVAKNNATSFFTGLYNGMVGIAGKIDWKGIGNSIGGFFSDVWKKVKEIDWKKTFSDAGQSVKDMWEKIKKLEWKDIKTEVIGFIDSVSKSIKESGIFKSLESVGESIKMAFSFDFSKFSSTMRDLGDSINTSVIKPLSDVATLIAEIVSALFNLTGQFAQGFATIGNLGAVIYDSLSMAVNGLRGLFLGVTGFFSDLINNSLLKINEMGRGIDGAIIKFKSLYGGDISENQKRITESLEEDKILLKENADRAEKYAGVVNDMKSAYDRLSSSSSKAFGFSGGTGTAEKAAETIGKDTKAAVVTETKETIAVANKTAEANPIKAKVEVDEQSIMDSKTRLERLGGEIKWKLELQPDGSFKNVRGFAGGGAVRGAGTGTSDSILARLSNGEFVMPARAVKHWGLGFMDALRSMSLPRFAEGGAANGQSAGMQPIYLNFGGQQLNRKPIWADSETAREITRAFANA